MNDERWLDVDGYDGNYMVSDRGRVKSVRFKKILTGGHGRYKCVTISKRGKQKTFNVHYLVAKMFLGDKPFGMEVNHVNGDKWDNSVDNLVYTTRQENIRHSYRIGLNKKKAHSVKVKDPGLYNLLRLFKQFPIRFTVAFLSI